MTSPAVLLGRVAVSSPALRLAEAFGTAVRLAVPAYRWLRESWAGLAGAIAVIYGIGQIYAPAGWIAAGLLLITRDVMTGWRDLVLARLRSGGRDT